MVSFHTITHKGDRGHNEDCAAVFREHDRWCCVVADGLGGMGGGSEASACVIETIKSCFEDNYLNERTLLDCCQEAHKAIKKRKKELHQNGKMFSTVVLLYGDGERVYWSHSGDSRLYLFEGTDLVFRTKDHSVPQMLASCGEIKEEEIRFHSDRNRLLACLGVDEDEAKLSALGGMELKPGLFALLCTDGFWELIPEDQMTDTLLRSHSVKSWLEKMEEIVRGNPQTDDKDNYTAVGMWCL